MDPDAFRVVRDEIEARVTAVISKLALIRIAGARPATRKARERLGTQKHLRMSGVEFFNQLAKFLVNHATLNLESRS